MKSNYKPDLKKRANISLILFFMTIFLSNYSLINAQNNDSLIYLINHSKSFNVINSAKMMLPDHLSKIDVKILDVARQLKSEGVDKSNISFKQINKRFSNDIVQIEDNGKVHTDIYLKTVDENSIGWLKSLDVEIEYVDKNFNRITCKAIFSILEDIAKNDNVTGIYSVSKPIVQTGTYTSAGDGILNASTARSTFNTTGSNIKVGVISDGVTNYQNVINSGDLPSTFQVINNRMGGNEGTAMSEIIYDLAPGASIAFADYGYSESDFASNVNALVNAGCNIIVDDIYYFSEPIFEDGTIAQTIDQVTANGVKYIAAAGNYNGTTWYGQSADANSNSWMEFNGTTEVNSFTVGIGKTIIVIMQWANKWGLSRDDYDLYLFDGPDASSNVLASSTDRQSGTGNPLEELSWTNGTGSLKTVYLRVKFYSVQSPRVIKIMGIKLSSSFNYSTDGSIIPHAAANSCISVGALDASSPQTVESFSSHGPSRIYSYDANGNPLSYTDRVTPTICGVDGVQSYVGMSGLWTGTPNYLFYGTSAAAPHVAGIIALLQSRNSSYTWQQAKSTIIQNAYKVSGMGGE
jgi:hypothetical protein